MVYFKFQMNRLSANTFQSTNFLVIASKKVLRRFYVSNIEPSNVKRGEQAVQNDDECSNLQTVENTPNKKEFGGPSGPGIVHDNSIFA